MSRQPKTLALNLEEFEQITRLVQRLKIEATRNPDRVGPSNIKVIDKLASKFNEQVDISRPPLEFILERKEKRFLQALVKSSGNALATLAIPAYNI